MNGFPSVRAGCLLAIWLLAGLPALFAAPRGKAAHVDTSTRVEGFFERRAEKQRHQVMRHSYLASLPPEPVAFRPSGRENGAPASVPGLLRPEYFSLSGPSLRGFMAFLEAEREAEPLPTLGGLEDTVEAVADGTTTEAGEAAAREGGTSGNPSPETTSSRISLQTTDPRQGGSPIFPRPGRFDSSVERFLVYFPMEEETDAEPSTILLPINFEAIFQPPGRADMRSSATLREGS